MKYTILILLVFTLLGCSSVTNLFGGSELINKNNEDRISVLKVGSTVRVDSSLQGVAVTIPKAKPNYKWIKSSGHGSMLPENIQVPKTFSKRSVVNIGAGGSAGIHISASPVIADGKIFTINMNGEVMAFDAAKPGKKIWVHRLDIPSEDGDFSSAGLLYHKGRVYVAPGYSSVVALNAKSGKLDWKRNINSIARSAPDAYGDTVLVNTIDNRLYAFNIEDGAIKWTHSGVTEEISVFGSASPLVYNNVALAPYSSGELYALSLEDGNEIWSDDLARSSSNTSFSLADIDASPIIVGNKIYAISNDGVLTAIELNTGKRLWEKEVSGNKTPWYSGGYLYLLSDTYEVFCVSAKTGGVKWVKKMPSYEKQERKSGPIYWNGPVMAGDLLLVVGSHGRMLSLSPENGEVLYRNKVPSDIYISPVVAHNQVYLLSNGGKLVLLRDSDVGHGLKLTEPVSPKTTPSKRRAESMLKPFLDWFGSDSK